MRRAAGGFVGNPGRHRLCDIINKGIRVPHRRLDIGVAQHFLNGPQVLECTQCARRTSVTQVVDPEVLDPSLLSCSREGGPSPLIADPVALSSLVALANLLEGTRMDAADRAISQE